MSANLTNPFGESCCDGGATGNDLSCQPCGCDPGAKWVCQRHQVEAKLREEIERENQRVREVRGGSSEDSPR